MINHAISRKLTQRHTLSNLEPVSIHSFKDVTRNPHDRATTGPPSLQARASRILLGVVLLPSFTGFTVPGVPSVNLRLTERGTVYLKYRLVPPSSDSAQENLPRFRLRCSASSASPRITSSASRITHGITPASRPVHTRWNSTRSLNALNFHGSERSM